MDKEENRKSGYYINIIITQTICVVIVLLSVLVLKYFFKGEYKAVKNWYKTEIATNTDIDEVLE